jgi:hypothetical protein
VEETMPKPKGRTLGKLVVLTITKKQYADIASCTIGRGGSQNLYRRLHGAVQVRDEDLILPVYDTDLEGLKREARRVKTGTWQNTARDVLQSNGITWEV